MITPETLGPAAARLYAQVSHLEIGDPENGLTAEDCGYPWATVCAAIAAPRERLYALLALPESPWQPAFDLETAEGWLLPWLANFYGVEVPSGISAEALRTRLREADARKRGTIGAMVQRAEETLEPGGAVYFRERDGSAYRITMGVFKSGDPALAVQRVREVKPGGVVLELEVSGAMVWGIARVAYDSWADVLDRTSTWEEFRDTVPA
jgi:hypothetical protein